MKPMALTLAVAAFCTVQETITQPVQSLKLTGQSALCAFHKDNRWKRREL